jgi:riboflavin synthase
LAIEIPVNLRPYFWAKGSVALNGVSLTINQVTADFFTVGLIPETLKRTNLKTLKSGDQINLEIDNMSRAFVRQMELEA